jgi:hypothetical protein
MKGKANRAFFHFQKKKVPQEVSLNAEREYPPTINEIWFPGCAEGWYSSFKIHL